MRYPVKDFMKKYLILFFVMVMSAQTFGQSKGKQTNTFTFKHGVSLNHWIGSPIDSYAYADPKWFDKKDAEWIASTGLDHIQLYVTGTEIITADEKIIAEKVVAIDSLIQWCKGLGLGVVISPGRMPAAAIDGSMSKEERVEATLKKLVANIRVFSTYFQNHGENVRFSLNIGSEDKELRNRYYQLAIAEIRKSNPKRKLYITAHSIDRLPELSIPKDDQNLIIAIEMAQSTEGKADAIDVFAWQFQEYFFTDKMPQIKFPGVIPKLDESMTTELGRWALKFSNTRIEPGYFDDKFKKVSRWMQRNHPKLEIYVPHFRYWTGYPFNPKTVKDKKSVNRFIMSFAKAAKKYKVNWCFYDYNSGSGIRYPNGQKALIFEALKLMDKESRRHS